MMKSKYFERGFAETILSTLFYHVIMMPALIFKCLAGMLQCKMYHGYY